LFAVNITGTDLSSETLSTFGEVMELVPHSLAIMKLRSEVASEELSGLLHERGMACGTLFRLYGDAAQFKGPAPVAPLHATKERLPQVEEAMGKVKPELIRATVETLSSIYSRHHGSDEGQTMALLMGDKYRSLGNGRADMAVGTFDHGSATRQASLIVRLEGTTRPDEIVVLGSHIDSIAFWGGRAPGADDNASGTATNLEVLRVILESGMRFERTIEIHGYAAEEIGLVGSQDMARRYRRDGKKVMAMMQFDMNLYRGKESDKIWFVTNGTSGSLNQGLGELTDLYVHIPWGQGNLSSGSSDHASWQRQGFPAAFPFERPDAHNPHIHTARDTIENSGSFTQAAAFAKLGVAYVAHYAGLESDPSSPLQSR